MVLGYVHKAYPNIYAQVAKHAGYDSVLLTKGVEGGLAPALNKPLRRFFIQGDLPTDVDKHKELVESQILFNSKSAALGFGDVDDPVQHCLDTGLAVLAGKPGTARDSLCLASAQILSAHSLSARTLSAESLSASSLSERNDALSLAEAVEKVGLCLDNGSALECFEKIRSV